jgi:hypothetical protein
MPLTLTYDDAAPWLEFFKPWKNDGEISVRWEFVFEFFYNTNDMKVYISSASPKIEDHNPWWKLFVPQDVKPWHDYERAYDAMGIENWRESVGNLYGRPAFSIY